MFVVLEEVHRRTENLFAASTKCPLPPLSVKDLVFNNHLFFRELSALISGRIWWHATVEKGDPSAFFVSKILLLNNRKWSLLMFMVVWLVKIRNACNEYGNLSCWKDKRDCHFLIFFNTKVWIRCVCIRFTHEGKDKSVRVRFHVQQWNVPLLIQSKCRIEL